MGFSKLLIYLWSFSAVVNLAAFFADVSDADKLFIAAMAALLALYNYKDYKRGE